MRKPFQVDILFTKMEELLGVRYIYEESIPAKLNTETESKIISNNQSVELQLSQMPSEWVEKIYDAANECCDDKILQLSEEMPVEFSSAAQSITALAKDFLFDEIIELAKLALSLQTE